MKIKKKEITIPIFNHSVTLIQSSEPDILMYLSALYKENLNAHIPKHASAMTFIVKGNIYIWWRYTDDISISVLAHEILHACYAIARSKGINIEDEETMCYLLQYIMNQSLCILSEQTDHIDHP